VETRGTGDHARRHSGAGFCTFNFLAGAARHIAGETAGPVVDGRIVNLVAFPRAARRKREPVEEVS